MATGVIPCEPQKRTLSAVGNLNDCVYQGEYLYTSTTSNIPEANTYGLCYVHSSNMPDSAGTGWTVQMAYSTTGQIYTRRKINSGGTWTPWRQVFPEFAEKYTDISGASTYISGGVLSVIKVGNLLLCTLADIKFAQTLTSSSANNSVELFTNLPFTFVGSNIFIMHRFNVDNYKPIRLRGTGTTITPWWSDIPQTADNNVWFGNFFALAQ